MALADALAEATRPHVPRCTFGLLLEALNDADRAALVQYADRRDVSGANIAKALKAEGHHMGESTVRRHRAGDCTCGTR